MTRRPSYRLAISTATLALVAAGLALTLRPAEIPYLDLLRQGDEHAARAERTAAAAAYREASHHRPRDPEPYLRLAQLYLDWGRADESLAAIIHARQLDPEGTRAERTERLLVAVHGARADWLAAAADGRRLLALAPDDLEAHHALARAYLELEAWGAAQDQYEALLRAHPGDVLAHERLGIMLIGSDPLAAAEHLAAAQTGLAFGVLAARQEASTVDDPAYTLALVGQVLTAAQEWPLAALQLQAALAYNPQYADAHTYLGYALDQMGHPDRAREHLERAVTLAPQSAVAHTFLALHHDRLGDPAAARAQYEAAYDLDPENPATCVAIGRTWAAERRYVAAEIWFQEAVSLEPQDPALWEALARFRLDHDITALDQTLEATTTLVELQPDSAQAHDLHGWAALQAGDVATAEASLQQALELDPQLATAHYHLAAVWSSRGQYERARQGYVRALDLDTSGELAPLVERALGGLP